MAFVECTLSEIDIFQPQSVQTSILSTDILFHASVASLENANVIEFLIPSSPDHYKDLNSIKLHLRLQLLQNDGTAYKADKTDQPALICAPLHSIFKSCAVYMNNQLISFVDNFGYKNYIDKLCTFDEGSLKSNLMNEGFIKDDTGTAFDALDDAKNKGLKERRALTANSVILDLSGKLNMDCFNIQKLLPNNVDVKILLTLESSKFYLMDKEKLGALKLHEATLEIKQHAVNPSILLNHRQQLVKHGVLRIPFKKSELKTYTVAGSMSNINLENLFSGILPTNVIIGLVSNSAFTGDFLKNPFYFHNQSVSGIALYVNSKCVTGTPIECNYKNDNYSKMYNQFLEGTGKIFSKHGSMISKSEYKRGFNLYPFILNATQTLDDCAEVPQEGTIRLDIKFDTAPSSPLTVLVYAEYDRQILIDSSYNCSAGL